jgi:phage FluMu protein gp41
MSTPTQPQEPASVIAGLAGIDDLYTLRLIVGLPAMRDGREIRYKVVKLRETSVADERIATRLAERVVKVDGKPTLLVSDAEFRLALTAQHCQSWLCDGIGSLDQDVVGLDTFCKLDPYDLAKIEDRVLMISLAAQLRHGLITAEDVQRSISGGEGAPPQPLGQVEGVGAPAGEPEPGPALLADFTGGGAAGNAAGLEQAVG